ncbi:MAG: ATP-dependent DNA helicase, partial [Bacteroidota bacterium]
YKWGDSMNCKPSRFLGEIDQVFLDMMTPQFEAGNDPDLPEPGTRKPFKRKAPNAFTTTAPNPHLSQMKRKLTKINEVKNPTNQFTPPDGFVPDDPEKISEGMLVTHLRFGPGEVRSIEGNDSQKKARIYFKNTGQEKVLLLKFARLKIIG